MVAGRWVVEDGRIPGLDLARPDPCPQPRRGRAAAGLTSGTEPWPTPPPTVRELPRPPPARPRRASWPSWSRCPPTTRPATARAHAEARGRAARGAGLHGRAPSGAGRAGARQRHDQLHQPRRAQALRRRAGGGAQRARRRGAARRRLDAATPSAPRSSTAGCTAAASRSRSPTSRPTPSRCWRFRRPRRPARSSAARSSCTSPTTRRPAARSGPRWLIEQGISKPDLALGAGFSYAVVNAHNGCLHLEVQVDGRSAHAAMPCTGIDALEAATHILAALYAWRKTLARAALARSRASAARS